MKMESLLNRIKREIQITSLLGFKGDKALDIGFGSGRYLKNINSDFLCALDINKWNIIRCNNLKGILFVLGNVENLPFKDSIFDKILFTEVLEHTFNPHKSLNEVKRVTKRRGVVVLSSPCANYPFFWDPENYIREHVVKNPRKKKSVMTNWTPDHKNLFTYSELRDSISPEFKIISTIYSGHIVTPFLNIVWYPIYGIVKFARYFKIGCIEKFLGKVFEFFLKIAILEDKIFNNEPCITLMIKAEKIKV